VTNQRRRRNIGKNPGQACITSVVKWFGIAIEENITNKKL
jgi:hypothetical protein